VSDLGIVISLCDRTGVFCRPWAEAGYDCYAVDTQHSIRRPRVKSIGAGTITFQWGDARSWRRPTTRPIAFFAAWPPCTDVSGSGARDHVTKGLRLLTDALDLFNACEQAASWSGAPYLIENPVGVLSSHVRKPDHYFHPWEYAGYLADPSTDNTTKKTCLWTGNGFVMPPPQAGDGAPPNRLLVSFALRRSWRFAIGNAGGIRAGNIRAARGRVSGGS
jgi:hypothetical protein